MIRTPPSLFAPKALESGVRDFAGRLLKPPAVSWPPGSHPGAAWSVLSLFDGISAGREALKRLGAPLGRYLASEIDPHAIAISKANHPDIERLGDVFKIKAKKLPRIDLLIGGSPCQDLSIGAVIHEPRAGLDGLESRKFWEYVRLKNALKPRWFLFENVASMGPGDKRIITEALGVQPFPLNAALVSAQTRKRLFWTNFPRLSAPQDRGILLEDVMWEGAPASYDHSQAAIDYMNAKVFDKVWIRHCRRKTLEGTRNRWSLGYHCDPEEQRKAYTLVAVMAKGVPYNVVRWKGRIRKLTEREACRLQGFPDDYLEHDLSIPYNPRMRAIGNSWSVPAVEHLIMHLAQGAPS